jgi:ketosteroid isomerase-like protein
MGIFGVILILSCAAGGEFKDSPRSDEMEKVLQADKQLSKKVESSGCAVLLEYLAKESWLLPQNGHHIKGRKDFQGILNKAEEKNLRCVARWEPFEGRVSSSGTLAYTYGRYRIDSQASPKEDSPQYNYYASIWKKHTSGVWKILFNMGLLDLKEWRDWDSLTVSPDKVGTVEKILMDVDRAFSELSVQKGYIEAFYSYISDDGITVSSGGPPANKETYRKRVEALKAQANPPRVQLVWEPVLAYVASSEDLGFTSGPFTLTVTDPSGQKSVQRGYYLSIWTKQPDGTWKFIFDGGNQVRG